MWTFRIPLSNGEIFLLTVESSQRLQKHARVTVGAKFQTSTNGHAGYRGGPRVTLWEETILEWSPKRRKRSSSREPVGRWCKVEVGVKKGRNVIHYVLPRDWD
jgi:hypothetical protein